MIASCLASAASAGASALAIAPAGGAEGAGLAGLLGPLCALCSSVTWAYGSAVYAREARRTGAVAVNFARSVIVLPLFVIGAILLHGRAELLALSPRQLGWLGLSSICSYGLGDLVFYLAAMRLGTPTALAIGSVYPVWATLAGALTLGEHIGPLRLAGTALCIAGVVWLVLLQAEEPAAPGPLSPTDDPVLQPEPPVRTDPAAAAPARLRTSGVVLAVLTSILWAGNTYSIRRGSVGLPLFAVNSVRYALALLILGASIAWQRLRAARVGRPPADDSARLLTSPRHLRAFMLPAVTEAFVGSSLFVFGLAHSPLSIAAPLSSLAPLFAVPVGVLMGTERLHLRRIAAILLTVGGVVLLVC